MFACISEALSKVLDAVNRSDRLHMLAFCKSWAIIRWHWSVRWLIFACISHEQINLPIPLTGQVIQIYVLWQVFTNYQMWLIGLIWSDYWGLLMFCNSGSITRYHWLVILFISTSAYRVCANSPMTLIGPMMYSVRVFYKSWAIARCHWLVGWLMAACIYVFSSLEQVLDHIDWSDHLY